MPGADKNDAFFIMRQMQEQYLAKHKNLYIGFVDREKAFDVFPNRLFGESESSESDWYTRTDCVFSVFSKGYVWKRKKQGHNQ